MATNARPVGGCLQVAVLRLSEFGPGKSSLYLAGRASDFHGMLSGSAERGSGTSTLLLCLVLVLQ